MKRLSDLIMHLTVSSYHHGVSGWENENIKPMSREILDIALGQPTLSIININTLHYTNVFKVEQR